MRLRLLTAALLTIPAFALVVAGTVQFSSAHGRPDGCTEHHGHLVANGQFCTHGDDSQLQPAGPQPSTAASGGCTVRGLLNVCSGYIGTHSPTPTPSPTPTALPWTSGCGGGASRIQAVYLRQTNQPDQLSSRMADIVRAAADADSYVDASAQIEGHHAHFRYVTDSSCHLIVQPIVTSRTLSSFSDEILAAQDAGLIRSDYIYLLFPDTNNGCGISSIDGDSRPDPAVNTSNNSVSYASVYLGGCRNGGTVTHELGHSMGAVQLDAPHSTGAWHCNDAWDSMCYDDGGPAGAQHTVCSSSWQHTYDCGRDDYFAFTPRGTYLPSHWNLIHSRWLTVT